MQYFTRDEFLKTILCGFVGLLFHDKGNCAEAIKNNNNLQRDSKIIRTVTGAINSNEMGLTLPHEHVMCDFIGADKVSKDRYNPDEIVATMLPYFEELRQCGVKTFVDCTPAYLGRDVRILERLSLKTGINIITNTGFYKEPYLPEFIRDISEDKLAELWEKEIVDGIENTGIKAGFIKIAVNPGPLIPIQKKIVIAACRTGKITGATIASHTGKGIAAKEQLDILDREKVDPAKFIFVHADGEPDMNYHFEVAQRGAWVEYDGINSDSGERHVKIIRAMVDKGFENNILLSQDAGWYNVGQKKGGKIRGYAFLIKIFLPFLEENGFTRQLIDKITIINPKRAFEMAGI